MGRKEKVTSVVFMRLLLDIRDQQGFIYLTQIYNDLQFDLLFVGTL